MNDAWRDSYDAWKLASPYDEYEPDCDHMDYEVDWEGRATCDCGATWWLTAEEYDRHLEVETKWAANYDRMQRREHGLFWRALRWLRSLIPRRRTFAANVDDDIPF